MKQQFIPLEKRTKRQQKAYHAAQRRDWGAISSTTKKSPNLKAYNRKKSEQWSDYEPCSDFYFSIGKKKPYPRSINF